MKNMQLVCGIVAVLGIIFVVILGLIGAGSYNRLVGLSQEVNKSWAQVENDYQRRSDLIPNLVNTVSGAANFEKSTLVEITQARASVGQVKIDASSAPTDAAQLAQYEKAQGQLSSALSRLLVVSENILTCGRIRTFAIYRRSWKGRKIGSPWRAGISTKRRATTIRR